MAKVERPPTLTADSLPQLKAALEVAGGAAPEAAVVAWEATVCRVLGDPVPAALSVLPLTPQQTTTVLLGFDQLLLALLRPPATAHTPASLATLLASLSVPPSLHSHITDAVLGPRTARRAEFDRAVKAQSRQYPGLTGVRWRVDVSVSTSHLLRCNQPTVTLQLATSDGNTHQLEMSVEKFHDLRYQVASLLSDMTSLAANPMLKIVDS